ncbi:MAG: M28 family peptidase [Candidatus Krumholzibacteria bacterium]|nr:M28 family peptidase [Candidatus Krumholzibacteria bacterium]
MRILAILAAVCAAAIHCSGCARSAPPAFDGASAFAFLKEQCDMGPRYPGSPGHAAIRRFLVEKLAAFGASVAQQPFEAVLSTGDTLRLVNIVGAYRPDARKRILLGAHYDTRPRADRDPDPANRARPIIGANDGGSGVAVLLELARLLAASKPSVGVDLVFFDGEDSGEEGKAMDYLLGSRRYAKSLGGSPPYAVIVIDMVGERDSRIPVEGFSAAASPALCARIYGIARTLRVPNLVQSRGSSIIDDHLPFIQAGIPAIDLIDFEYRYWHTLADTPDKCSSESLAAVGSVLVRYLWEER